MLESINQPFTIIWVICKTPESHRFTDIAMYKTARAESIPVMKKYRCAMFFLDLEEKKVEKRCKHALKKRLCLCCASYFGFTKILFSKYCKAPCGRHDSTTAGVAVTTMSKNGALIALITRLQLQTADAKGTCEVSVLWGLMPSPNSQ